MKGDTARILCAALLCGCAVTLPRRSPAEAPVAASGKPVALIGFPTDTRGIEAEVMRPERYVYETFENKWLDPKEYGRYSVLYFGEKLDGAAKGKSWMEPEARAAAEKFVAGGGTVIVAGDYCLRQLLGWPNKNKTDPLREKIIHIKRGVGRTKANYGKEGRILGYPDDAGNYIVTPEGQDVQALASEYKAAFAKAKGAQRVPVEGKWEAKPLGEPGYITCPTNFAKRPKLGKPVPRKDGLVLFDGGTKAKIALGGCGEEARKLADELAWHLEKMCGAKFEIVDGEPEKGPALAYRSLKCPAGFARGTEAYFKIWREGDKVFLGGEDTGLSRATTYVLEALGCRYIWPGESGKIIPKKTRMVLPEIAVEDATPFVVRRIRLYGKPEWRDREENRDFYRWHGMNDTSFMTTGWPGPEDRYEWGHYYGDYYGKYYKNHREWFALQPDGTRNLHLGKNVERPMFCLSNMELVRTTAERIKAGFRANPSKKALSICLPDTHTVSQCMCEECRKLDPVNARPGGLTVFYPARHRVPYVALTDRVFTFMNRIAEEVEREFPDRLLSCYAYSVYTVPPVRVRPHRNLLILSAIGDYSRLGDGHEVERNVASWCSFGNKILWRPNAHDSFHIGVPDNVGRRMFDDISLLAENGIFGVDYDTMSSEWATKPFMYYVACKAHFNPDRLDFDAIFDDYCKAGFGAGWKSVREYFEIVERACDKAARENFAAPPAISWELRVAASNRLPNATDYDALDRCLAAARAATAGDVAIAARIDRLQFAADLGRIKKKTIAGKASEEEKEAARQRIKAYMEKDPSAYPAKSPRLTVK